MQLFLKVLVFIVGLSGLIIILLTGQMVTSHVSRITAAISGTPPEQSGGPPTGDPPTVGPPTGDPPTEGPPTEGPPTEGLHVVTMFPVMDSPSWRNLSYKDTSNESLQQRQDEYVTSLRSNLGLSIVEKIHLLTDQPELLAIKLATDYRLNVNKTRVHAIPKKPTYRAIFQYASDFLQGKVVFIVNSDILIGEGFDQIDIKWWKTHSENAMYALTRHPLKNRPADCQTVLTGYCDPQGSEIGSHDGFLFHMDKPLPEAFLKELEFPSDSYGSENVIIWGVQKILHYHVTNPCRRLVIYHNHCSNVRPSDGHRIRVNINGKSGSAGFTS